MFWLSGKRGLLVLFFFFNAIDSAFPRRDFPPGLVTV